MYLKGTMSYDIMFSSEQGGFSVVGYLDSNYAGDMNDMMSIKGMSLL